MRFVKRICIFFIIPVTMFACGFAANMYLFNFFYPGREQINQKQFELLSAVDITAAQREGSFITTEPEAMEVGVSDLAIINADTTYIIQQYDGVSGVMEEVDMPVPDKYMGMDRELFVKTMEEYNTFPSLSDLEKGFTGCEVVSFSPQKVVVRKTFVLEEMPPGYFLVNENNYITVYYGDMKTVYMNTNIELTQLSDQLQQEIMYIKFIEQEEELYDFLEAYSS